MLIRTLLLLLLLGCCPSRLAAEEITVAVASNFLPAARDIGSAWQHDSGHQVRWVSGATGQHHAQIVQGAPFDAWLAADAERPQRIEAAGLGVAGSRFTYAIGRLALWSPDAERVDAQGAILGSPGDQRLALANPRLAPYGQAAMQALTALGLEDAWSGRLVQGQNVGQAFQFVASGNAELGLIALSQVLQAGHGSHWVVPDHLHRPIQQQAMALRNTAIVNDFLTFLRGDTARALMRERGYGDSDAD